MVGKMSEKSDGMIGISDHSLTFELVNDKAELEAAIAEIQDVVSDHENCDPDYCDLTLGLRGGVLTTLLELVPRLMASYEEALQLTHSLADAWESYMDNQTPAGIYVPS